MIAIDDLIDDPRNVHVSGAAGIDEGNVIVGTARFRGADRAVLLRPR